MRLQCGPECSFVAAYARHGVLTGVRSWASDLAGMAVASVRCPAATGPGVVIDSGEFLPAQAALDLWRILAGLILLAG